MDESGRNTIAQGEVQRIINMGGKERRQIIDSVAGISDFEAKKDEAMRELEQVNNKIKDANLVLGEKTRFLHNWSENVQMPWFMLMQRRILRMQKEPCWSGK